MVKRWRSSSLLFRTLFSILFITAFFAVSTAPALAASSRTYAVADWDTTWGGTAHAPKNEGGYADMYIASGSVYDGAAGGHINQTIWVATDNSTSAGTYWVEGGYTYGYQGSSALTYYWAHQSPVYGYGDHRITSITPTVGNWEPIEILYNTNNTWNIYYNWQVGSGPDGSSQATGNALWSYGMVAGLESTDTNNHLTNAKAYGLEYEDPQGTWHTGWNTTNNLSYLHVVAPAYASWNTQYQQITDGQ
jgi:hypothetical protein